MISSRRSAFSLLEATIVLSIVGVALGGVWAVVSSIRDAVMAHQLVDRYAAIASNVRMYNSTRALTGNLTTYFDSTAVGSLPADILPDEMCNSTCRTTVGSAINFPYKSILRQNFAGYTERFSIGTGNSYVSGSLKRVYAIVLYSAASPSGPVSLVSRGGCLRFLAELDARAQELGLYQILLSVSSPATLFSRTYPGANAPIASTSAAVTACQTYAASTSAKSIQINFNLWPRDD